MQYILKKNGLMYNQANVDEDSEIFKEIYV